MWIWLRLLFLAIYAVLVVAAFLVGFELGQARMSAVLQPEVVDSRDRVRVTENALSEMSVELAMLKQECVVLERSLEIERETQRSLQTQLKAAQDERLALIKQSNYMKRLISDDGKGAVRVHDLRLMPSEAVGTYRYGFTVTQLVPGVGKSTGRIVLRVDGEREGKDVSLSLADLPDADPRSLSMNFEFFQNYQGVFGLPEGLLPRFVSITIEPEGDDLLRTSEAFPWAVSEPGVNGRVPLGGDGSDP